MKKIIFITTLCLSLALMQEGKKSKNLKLMMKWKLTEYLDLGESQAEKFFPKMNSHEKEIKSINTEIITLKNRLEEHIQLGTASKRQNLDMIDQIQRLEEKKIKTKYNYIRSLDGVLQPQQISKIMVFDKKFKRSLKEQIREVPPHRKEQHRR